MTTQLTTTEVVAVEAAPVVDAPTAPDSAASPWLRWRFVLLVGAAVLAGFAIRGAIGLTDDAASTDETAYIRSGMSIVEGEGFERDGRPELHFPPFVPFLIGQVSRVVDDPHVGKVWMTVVSGTALIVPLALLGRRIAGDAGGVATAWVAAIAPGLATMPQTRGTGSEAEYALLVVTALLLAVVSGDRTGRVRLACVSAAGLLMGFAYLTRPEGVLIAVPLAIAIVARSVRGVAGWAARLRSTVTLMGAFAAALLVCIVPYAMFLHSHTGQWQLTAKTQDASIEAWQSVARGDREARNRVLYSLDESGLHFSAGRSSLLSLARDDPSGYLDIVGTNVKRLWRVMVHPEEGLFLAWLLLPLPVWLLAVVGAARHRRRPAVRLLLGVGALPVATALAFFIQPRYLVVMVALGTVLAGAAMPTISPRLRRPLFVGVGVLLALSTMQTFRGEVAGWWHPVEQTDQRRAGEWIAANTDPEDRIMTRSMIVEYYAERTTVAVPYAEFDQIMTFARHYGAKYLVADWYTVERLVPQLGALAEDDHPSGLRLVYEVRAEGRTARVFALDPVPAPSSEPAPSLGFVGDGAA